MISTVGVSTTVAGSLSVSGTSVAGIFGEEPTVSVSLTATVPTCIGSSFPCHFLSSLTLSVGLSVGHSISNVSGETLFETSAGLFLSESETTPNQTISSLDVSSVSSGEFLFESLDRNVTSSLFAVTSKVLRSTVLSNTFQSINSPVVLNTSAFDDRNSLLISSQAYLNRNHSSTQSETSTSVSSFDASVTFPAVSLVQSTSDIHHFHSALSQEVNGALSTLAPFTENSTAIENWMPAEASVPSSVNINESEWVNTSNPLTSRPNLSMPEPGESLSTSTSQDFRWQSQGGPGTTLAVPAALEYSNSTMNSTHDLVFDTAMPTQTEETAMAFSRSASTGASTESETAVSLTASPYTLPRAISSSNLTFQKSAKVRFAKNHVLA